MNQLTLSCTPPHVPVLSTASFPTSPPPNRPQPKPILITPCRAVTSSDGMTADWYEFSGAFLRDVSTRICNQIREVNRVCYDITSKPPGTIEWE